jgi:hypothetical protein
MQQIFEALKWLVQTVVREAIRVALQHLWDKWN